MTIGGHTFESLGVSGSQLNQQASGEDILTLQLESPIDAASVFTPYTEYAFVDGAFTQTFWLDLQAMAAQPAETRVLQFVSAFRFLDLAHAKQLRPVKNPTTGELELIDMTALTLGQAITLASPTAAPEIEKISASVQVTALKDQFTAQFPTITITGNVGGIDLPWSLRTNATIATCLLDIMGWFPTYQIRSTATGLEIVNGSAGTAHAIAESTHQVGSISIRPRHDLLTSETKLTFVKPPPKIIRTSSANTDRALQDSRTDTATTANGSPRTIHLTIELEAGEPFPSDTIAATFQAYIGQLLLDVDLLLFGLNWAMKPGHRLDLGGAFAQAADPPIIQTISRDLFAGTCQIKAGPRNHLGLDKLIEMARKRSKGGGDTGDSGGTEEEPGTVNIIIMGHPDSANALWSVGPMTGKGNDSVEVPAGSYTVIFAPFWDESESGAGRLYFAPAVEVSVTAGGTDSATGDFNAIHRLKLQGLTGNEEVIIDADAIPADKGPAEFREIERCDGKRSMVLMTDWYDAP